MSRKFAAFVATGVALAIVVGSLLVLALGHSRPPKPAAATTQTSSTTPPTTPSPTQTPIVNAPDDRSFRISAGSLSRRR